MEIIIGDYTAKQESSWLKELEQISTKRGENGLFHSGIIHYVQNYLDTKGSFTLKAAIAPILDAVPLVFPKDLPQKIIRGEITSLNKPQKQFLIELNKGLLLPLTPDNIAIVILAGQEYEKTKGKQTKG